MKNKVRLTVTVDYYVDTDEYMPNDPKTIAEIELFRYKHDIDSLMEMVDTKNAKISVTPIKASRKKK